MELAHSIRFLYRHFLSGITEKSLNTFSHACSYAKVDYSRFMNVTTAMALKLVLERLKSQPVFLCIDDTMVARSGKSLKMYQNFLTMPHIMVSITSAGAALSALCFVSPVWRKQRIAYLAIPPIPDVEKRSILAGTGSIHGTECYAKSVSKSSRNSIPRPLNLYFSNLLIRSSQVMKNNCSMVAFDVI